MSQLGQVFNCQAGAITIVQNHRVRVRPIKEPVNKNIRLVCQVKSSIGFISPWFHKNDPINRPADQLVNCFALQFRIPIRADNDAEIIVLPEIFLNAADQDRRKWAGNVIDNETYRESSVCLETTRSDIGMITQLVRQG